MNNLSGKGARKPFSIAEGVKTVDAFGLSWRLRGKEPACKAGDLGSSPRLGRSPGEGNGHPLQSSGLENPHGQRGIEGYSPWGHKESDMTARPSLSLSFIVGGSLLPGPGLCCVSIRLYRVPGPIHCSSDISSSPCPSFPPS